MMTNYEYLRNEFEIFKRKYNPKGYFISNKDWDEDIKEVWNETTSYWKSEYAKIDSKECVFSYLKNFETLVESVEKDRPHWNRFQQTDMMQKLYYLMSSIEKAIICYDNLNCNFQLKKEEIDELFLKMNALAKRMKNINSLRMMQD